MRLALSFVAFVLAGAVAAQPSLGETQFANSGAAAAQEPFLRGLLLLHSFEYDDARDAFQEARRIDPGFAMAAWGEAMTHNHPVWLRQDRAAGRAALADVSASGLTEREQAYLATLDVLFGEGAKEDRDDLYAEAMRGLAERYPDDLDARSFYALALLGTAHEGRDFRTYMEAAAVAEEVFAENPRHPGAAHYLIHAYDDPVHAPLGLRPARVYDRIAPAASHALHMPSHIYLALGMWPETAEMNRRSYEAARDNSDRRGEALNGHGWHALWWWHYAATQLDDRPLADSLLAVAEAHHAGSQSGTSLAHAVRMRSAHALAFDAWRVVLDAPAPDASAGTATLGTDALARGLGQIATATGDAQATLDRLDAALDADGDAPWTAVAAQLQLAAALHESEGNAAEARGLLEAAAALEGEAPLMFGPPAPTIPAHEALATFLLAAGDRDGAAAAFEASLGRQTGRRQSVAGLADAQVAPPAQGATPAAAQ